MGERGGGTPDNHHHKLFFFANHYDHDDHEENIKVDQSGIISYHLLLDVGKLKRKEKFEIVSLLNFPFF